MDRIIGRRPSRGADPSTANGMVLGRVITADASGVRFTIPEWDGGKHEFGPSPWSMGEAEPPDGAWCLVAFLPPTPDMPGLRSWVLGWWTGPLGW
jgi:hypothetical protein